MQTVIDNAEIVVRHIIGADCTFSHNERHKVLKGYLEVDNKENEDAESEDKE